MRIYLASRYSRKEELRTYRSLAESCGATVTSSWLKESYSPNIHMSEVPEATSREIADIDLWDIRAADTFVFFSEDQDKQPPRGGRHFEMGYALAHDKRMFVIGKPENIFHFLPEIKFYDTFPEFLHAEVKHGS